MINLLKIDTKLVDKFNGVVTLGIVGVMIFVVARFLISKNTIGAVTSILICGLLLWAVNDLNSFMTFINNVIGFIGGVFSG
jgi:VIT1/CCC1 family predicted Fe2+/Mn2+ transporter